jgi:hypothetical protein
LRLNKLNTALLATAAGSIIGYVLLGGASLASAAVRHRSGVVHQQLADHISAGRTSDVMTGADIMGAIVLLMAIIATLFLVTTFIRRRATVPVTSS